MPLLEPISRCKAERIGVDLLISKFALTQTNEVHLIFSKIGTINPYHLDLKVLGAWKKE